MIGDEVSGVRWPWGVSPGMSGGLGYCAIKGTIANSSPMAYNVEKLFCNSDGSLSMGQYGVSVPLVSPILQSYSYLRYIKTDRIIFPFFNFFLIHVSFLGLCVRWGMHNASVDSE